MIALAPQGVSLHFHRMDGAAAPYPARSTARTERTQRDDRQPRRGVELLALVKPDIIVIAHTATSYSSRPRARGRAAGASHCGERRPVVTAFGAVAAALERLQVRRIAYGAPYSAETTAQGRPISKRTGSLSSARKT